MKESFISQVPLFSSLSQAEIRHLADTLRPSEFGPGTVLFSEGEYGDRFYVVIEGQVEIIKALDTPDERRMSTRGPGEYIGEMSLLNRDGLRTASARTLTPARFLEMTRADFDALLHRQPTLAYEMVRVLSARLRASQDATIRDLTEKNRQLEQAYEELKAAQAQIIEKEKLERELQLARGVQASLLPRATPRVAGWEFAAWWQPARQVAGDFYDFIPVAVGPGEESSPGLGLVIADVSDKGMPAALFMALSRSIVRASVAHALSPAQAITQANRLVCADSSDGMFVTLLYALLDPVSGQLTYVNAGHNPPIVYRADQDCWFEFERTGIALGLFDPYKYEQRTLQFNVGDFVVLYTDGVTEAVDAQGQRFEEDRLRQVLLDRRRASAAQIVEALRQAIAGFTDVSAPFDDITIVVAKRV
ncbi:MAG TPA: SpoIIE family protein phosphatase [Anaerolineae bacterium]|nr:SpoIIE family protein phosphatase [Anaerolineae bacterium]